MLLKDKLAVVYGSSGAAGGAVARAYAREGASVFLAVRDHAALERVPEAMGAAAGGASVTSVESTSAELIRAHLDTVVAAAGPVRLMFNGVSWVDAHGTTLRRNAGLAQIADAAVLLSSDLASGMTATVAHVTGGGPDFIEEERPC